MKFEKPKTQMELLHNEIQDIITIHQNVINKLKVKYPKEPYDVFGAKIDSYNEVISLIHVYITGKGIGEGILS